MKNLLWFAAGAAVGVVVAHLVDKDPRGHELLADIDARIAEFTDRVGDAYREQESKFTAAVQDATAAATKTVHSVADAATGAVSNAKDLASRATDPAADAVDGADAAVSDAWNATPEGTEDASATDDGDAAEPVAYATDPSADDAAR